MINEVVISNKTLEEKKNIITKCLQILKLMIEESEKKGTACLKSHNALLKIKLLNLRIINNISKNVTETIIKVYGKTTIWELKEIIASKIGISVEFLRLRLSNNFEVQSTDHGKTLITLKISDGDDLYCSLNDLESSIPQKELSKDGEVTKEVIGIFTEWYFKFSTDGKMTRDDCGRFIKAVTGSKDTIDGDDQRVSNLFNKYDMDNDGILELTGFLTFYINSTLSKPKVVWDNMATLGVRHDLKKVT